jgi:allene oxide cyclase
MGSERLNLGASGRRTRTILTAAALAATGVLAAGVSSASAGPSARKSSAKTVHVIEHAVTDTVVHSGGKGDKNGNTLTFHNKVFDTSDKKQVGTDQGFCMRISPADGSWECFWTTFLKHGQITVEGPFYDTKNSVLAVTGGTGAYRDARGEMNLNSRNGGKEFDFIFHLDQ